MSRDDGFARADIDVGLLTDAKVRRLARSLPNDGELAATLLVYLSTVLESWREGRRLTATEAESWFHPSDERIAALQSVDLLDEEGRVPERAWDRWYGPAHHRREQAREAGREGNRRRWGSGGAIGPRSGSDAGRSRPDPRHSPSQSFRPSAVHPRQPPPNGRSFDRQSERQRNVPEHVGKTLERLGPFNAGMPMPDGDSP